MFLRPDVFVSNVSSIKEIELKESGDDINTFLT